jgi:hypothetical protein
MTNVQVNLFYRDASNYKTSGAVVFAGPLRASDVLRLERCLVSEMGMIPSAVGLSNLSFDEEGRSDDDHPWHDVTGVIATKDEPEDDRTFAQFVRDCERASWLEEAARWEAETPLKEYVPDEDDFDDDLDEAA